jgi:hypothetical protein
MIRGPAVKKVVYRGRILAGSSIATAFFFVWLNTWHVYPCWDCMVKRGRPFAYRVTEGFATPGRYLWRGLLADCVVFLVGAAVLYWLSVFVLQGIRRKQE